MSSVSAPAAAAAKKFLAQASEQKVQSGSEKKNRSRLSKEDRLTVSQVADKHPVVQRYVAFSRSVLRHLQRADSEGSLYNKETRDAVAAMALGFYLTECAAGASGQALPGQKAKGAKQTDTQTKAIASAQSEQTERKRDPKTAELAQRLRKFTPSKVLVSSVLDGDEYIEVHKDATAIREQMRHKEASDTLERMSKKDQKVLEHLCDNFESSKNFASDEEVSARFREITGALPEPKGCSQEVKDTNEELFREIFSKVKPKWLRDRAQRVDFRVMLGSETEMTTDQMKASLRAWHTFVDKLDGWKPEEKDLKIFADKGQVPLEALKLAIDDSVKWGKTRNLGLAHPRTLLASLSVAEGGVSEELLNHFKTPVFSPLFEKRKPATKVVPPQSLGVGETDDEGDDDRPEKQKEDPPK